MAVGWLLTLPAAAVVGAVVWYFGRAFGTSPTGATVGSLVTPDDLRCVSAALAHGGWPLADELT